MLLLEVHVLKETAKMVMAYSFLMMEEFMKDYGKRDYLTEWLIFISGSKYAGEFQKGHIHGYGKINLLDGREIKCEVVNDEIQVDESTK